MSTQTAAKPETKHVYQAIADVTQEMAKEGIAKGNDAKGMGASYKFRGIDDVYNALASLLAKSKLVILPRMVSRSVIDRQSKNGGLLIYVTVEAEFDLVSAVDGSCHTARTFGEAMDSSDKATNKAMSAAYKYMAFQTFCIPTEGDNDADATIHELAPANEQPKTQQAATSSQPKQQTQNGGPPLVTVPQYEDGMPNWSAYGQRMEKGINLASSVASLNAFLQKNSANLTRFHKEAPSDAELIDTFIEHRRGILAQAPAQGR